MITHIILYYMIIKDECDSNAPIVDAIEASTADVEKTVDRWPLLQAKTKILFFGMQMKIAVKVWTISYSTQTY